MLDWLTGTRRPAPGVLTASPETVRSALLAVSRPTAPFAVRPGTLTDGKGVDLVAEWRLADPAWFAVFAPVRLKQFRILMQLLPERHEVRTIDRMLDVQWTAGRPTIAGRVSRGQVYEINFEVPPFVETTTEGQQFRFRFATAEMKGPLREAVTAQGWVWRGALLSLSSRPSS